MTFKDPFKPRFFYVDAMILVLMKDLNQFHIFWKDNIASAQKTQRVSGVPW